MATYTAARCHVMLSLTATGTMSTGSIRRGFIYARQQTNVVPTVQCHAAAPVAMNRANFMHISPVDAVEHYATL
jgi:hypothetical protein